MSTNPPTTAKSRRRWLQFSLRTLLALMLVCGCGLGWLAHEIHQARQQREAVKAIATRQHWVSYAPNGSSSTIETGLAWLRRLVGEEELFKTLTEVGLVGHQTTDAGLVHLEGLAPLRRLYLGDSDVTDAGLVHLRGLTNLKLLNLRGTLVTDAGLTHLRGLTQLQRLDLSGTQVTAAGVAELQKALPKCEIVR
jgi:hypothetical protein